jgi:rhamnose transport system ATP-binding protein
LAEKVGFEDLAAMPERTVGSLRVSDQQKVEILRALARRAQLIVMDEPTAALPSEDAKVFLKTVRGLRDRGITILYISHYLQEVLAVSDSVSILRDGHLIRTATAAEETPESLVAAMLGRPGDLAFPAKKFPTETASIILSVRGLARPPGVNGVDFEVREGEIVGLAGLIGSGRTEIARLVTGADRPTSGEIHLDGDVIHLRSPRDAINRGIALLPESRKDQGLFLHLPVRDNITLSHLADLTSFGILRPGREKAEASKTVDRLAVKPASLKSKVATLSGGNQQKVLFARSLFLQPRVLVVDEPTRGVDVGAKRSIYELIVALAEQGLGVVLISSELEEVIGLAHRVLVVREGRIVTELKGDEIEEEAVLQAAFATRQVSPAPTAGSDVGHPV